MLGTQSLYIQDMLGNTSMDFKTEFECVDVLVHSINAIVASKISMDKFGVTNWAELQAYIAEHPFEVSVAMLTATGVDGASLAQATEGLDLMEIPYSSGADANSALVGGHCDLYVCGWDDIAGLIESGDIVPILALCENRMSIAPDMQCSVENGIDSVMGPWRGIFAKKGTPQEAIDTLVAAIEQAKQSETWKEFTHNAAYDERPIPAPGEETVAFCQSEYKDLHDYMVEQGTLVKDYEDLK